MSRPGHTYGQTCHLARSISYSNAKRSDDQPPYLNAQYFYYASYSVDDPLSAIPITSGADAKSTQYPPLPFSARDNNALEEAWMGISTASTKVAHSREDSGNVVGESAKNGMLEEDAKPKASTNDKLKTNTSRSRAGTTGESATIHDAVLTSFGSPTAVGRVAQGFPSAGLLPGRSRGLSKSDAGPPKSSGDISRSGSGPVTIDKRQVGERGSASGSVSSSLNAGSLGTTGRPFVKLPERSSSLSRKPEIMTTEEMGGSHNDRSNSSIKDKSAVQETSRISHICKNLDGRTEHSDVPVGISRLYLVELPTLLMKPIYWAHVHDTAPVIRATWFYKDSMLPVEPLVANQLEIGYRDLRPWSQTWQDELTSAIEVGASGEEKIAHRLWPKDDKYLGANGQLSHDPRCAARCFNGEASAEGTLDDSTKLLNDVKAVKREFPNAQVIYKDDKIAFILKPTLQPSAYYGRKPLQKIKRGRIVGIEVVRGFDRSTWDKLHPPKKVVPPKVAAKVPISGDAATAAHAEFCPACKASDERPNVTDLCLVIHGIGQKLSERVESFNFTHACNSVRRYVNVELGTDSVKKVLRKDLGGIMVLPVNWRSNLSFEDGGPRTDGDKEDAATDFSLKDITPGTIPAVRNLISDVMLDIPFYMSHHKEKMIAAVVKEANRVYRLWCKNNPGFHEHGRVHVIAHSLGSPMTLEILSRQPTEIGRLSLQHGNTNTEHFDFNTVNLFCAGSPAGFFLLLQNSKLVPRRGRRKPAADFADDEDQVIVGEAGTFGCLAVDNIYNILHCNDPIAYRLNATVDPQYAASVKEAYVPSATTGFFEGIGNAMRNVTPGLAPPVDVGVGQVVKPGMLPRLPSQLEMEIHDFTREEIAEKKFYLLNDNCQIDWLLSSGGGPFDIAYLDMLGAHSSYWEKKEFIRLLVTEIGREPGKHTTLPNMRAQKKTYKI